MRSRARSLTTAGVESGTLGEVGDGPVGTTFTLGEPFVTPVTLIPRLLKRDNATGASIYVKRLATEFEDVLFPGSGL
jgi:hypothetical protein